MMTLKEAAAVALRALEICPAHMMREEGYDAAECEEAMTVLREEVGE